MSKTDIKRIGILGAGTIGSSWAAFFAGKGLHVRYYDSVPETMERAHAKIRAGLEFLRANDLADEEDCAEGDRHLEPADGIETLVQDADLIQESATEDYGVKNEVLAAADAHSPSTAIIASSSSGLLMTELQKVMARPERALIAHPFNPPHLVPLVELVPGEQTSPETLDRAHGFYEALGKIPVQLKKEVPGHIANRLAGALWREALDLVASGVASVEDVDKALHAGPGLRWALMGQHLIYHLGGGEGGYQHFFDHIGKTFEAYWRTMPSWTQIPEEARQAAIEGVEESLHGRSIAEISAWRDEKLVKLVKAIYG